MQELGWVSYPREITQPLAKILPKLAFARFDTNRGLYEIREDKVVEFEKIRQKHKELFKVSLLFIDGHFALRHYRLQVAKGELVAVIETIHRHLQDDGGEHEVLFVAALKGYADTIDPESLEVYEVEDWDNF